MMVNPTDTLGQLVEEDPRRARTFERLGLDYCCGGQRSLAEACATRELDVDSVVAELSASDAAAQPSDDAARWGELGMTELVDRLESVHHRFAWDAIERLGPLVDKIHAVHGERHPELAKVRELFGAIVADLDPHLRKEEQVLFPMIRRMDAAPAEVPSLAPPIRVMLAEHDHVGELFEQLERETGGYRVPDDGCPTYQACYAGLAELQADTHLHIHRENNVLFPAVLAAG